MGKPFVLIRGRNYFLARCPRTHDILNAIADPGAGRAALSGPWIVTCPDCGSHVIDLSTMTSEPYRPFTSSETPVQFGRPHL